MSSVNVLTVHLILKLQKLQDILSFSTSAGPLSRLGVEQLILMKIHSKGFQPFEHKDESLNYLGRTCQRVDWTDNQCVIVGSFSFPEESMSGSSKLLVKLPMHLLIHSLNH